MTRERVKRYRATVEFDSVDDDKVTFMAILRETFKGLEGRTINWHRHNIVCYEIEGEVRGSNQKVKNE